MINAQLIISKIIQERKLKGYTISDLAIRAGIDRSALSLIEAEKRTPTLETFLLICNALEISPIQIFSIEKVNAQLYEDASLQHVRNENKLIKYTGLTAHMLVEAINYTYATLGQINRPLIDSKSLVIENMVELANLSSMLGNILGAGIASASNGLYERNKPHHYPDLLPKKDGAFRLELKVALEKNRPKGHLPKPGRYITFRYVLLNGDGKYDKRERGARARIWEVKVGDIGDADFDISNTEGDSGKTAVIKTVKFNTLDLVYFEPKICPNKIDSEGKYIGYN